MPKPKLLLTLHYKTLKLICTQIGITGRVAQ
jgi:hypothetical protein